MKTEAPSVAEVNNKLHEYFQAKAKVRLLRVELIRMATMIGHPQKDAIQDPVGFLDGYIVGSGFVPTRESNQ